MDSTVTLPALHLATHTARLVDLLWTLCTQRESKERLWTADYVRRIVQTHRAGHL
jgi:hypothetical protein